MPKNSEKPTKSISFCKAVTHFGVFHLGVDTILLAHLLKQKYPLTPLEALWPPKTPLV